MNIPIFVHFVGSSSFTSDFDSMIIRLFKEINTIAVSCGGVELDLPNITDESIVENIFAFFQLVATRYKVSTLRPTCFTYIYSS
jgi:hypothetical protein